MSALFRCRKCRGPLWLVLIVALLSVLACHQPLHVEAPIASTPPTSAATAPDQSAQVMISFACQGSRRSEFETLAAWFQEQAPNVSVRFVAVEDVLADLPKDSTTLDRDQRLTTAADTQCLGLSTSTVDAGLARDLTPYIESDPNFGAADFFPGLLDAFRYKDGVWALPADAWVSVLYYRQDAFEQAGAPQPTLDWTPAQFLATAQKLTDAPGDKSAHYGFLDHGALGRRAWLVSLLQAAGPDAPLTSDVFAGGLRWYTDLAAKHGVMPPAKADAETSQAGLKLIAAGAAAMWFEALVPEPAQFGAQGAATQPQIGLALFPTRTGPKAPATVRSYWMSAGTNHPDESWRWLQFLTRQQPTGRGARASLLPARQSVATQMAYWDQFNEQIKPLAQGAAEHLALIGLDGRWAYLNQAVEAVWSGETVEAGLSTAQQAWEQARSQNAPSVRVPAVDTPAAADQVKSCAFAPPVDSDPAAYRLAALAFNSARAGARVTVLGQADVGRADAVVSSLAAFGQARNLQPLISADIRFQTTDYLPQALIAFQREGDLWGIPVAAKARVMYYNRALFDAAGVSYPKPGWTLDDFLVAARQLTRGEGAGKQFGFVSYSNPVTDLLVFLAAQDAWPWDKAGRPQFAAPGVVTGVHWFTDLALAYGVTPAWSEDWLQPDENAQQTRAALVRDGHAAMWADFSGLQHGNAWGTAWPAQEVVGMAPMPVGRIAATRFLWDGVLISAHAADPQICWEWTQYVAAQAELSEGMPARHAFLEEPAFANKLSPDVLATYRALADYTDAPIATTSRLAAEEQWLAEAAQQILQGADPQTALAAAQTKAEGY